MLKILRNIFITLTSGIALCSPTPQAKNTIKWSDYDLVYTLQASETPQHAKGQLGYIEVPENRQQKNSKKITLGFMRLSTTAANPGHPIVYLAGGPGGAGTDAARGPRFTMFEKLREIADVIILDQRGTGFSRNGLENCHFKPDIALTENLTRESYFRNMQAAAKFCAAQWGKAGVNLNAYNTLESAADLEDLRQALGAEKINLLAISYGTHLSFAMAKIYPEAIDKMVLASAEGPDQTIKRPALVDAQLQRIATEIEQDETAKLKYPDLIKLINTVHQQYRESPLLIKAQNFSTGHMEELMVGELDIQLMTAGGMTRDPDAIANLPGFYSLLNNRDLSLIGGYFLRQRTAMWEFNPMSVAMDAASGISKKRWVQIQKEAETSPLWRASNLPFPDINRALGVKDLGDTFRQNPLSSIPSLFLSGTLDGRTFMESHQELAKGFENSTLVFVKRGGHNLFMTSPKVLDTIFSFYAGERVENFTIEGPSILFK